MNYYERISTVYTAYSKHYFFAKNMISAYVLNKGYIPLNPFTNWGYFLDDLVERDLIVRGNNNFILLADEVWTFGPIADGVFAEVKFANSRNMPIKHFTIGKNISNIQPLANTEVVFEDELLEQFAKEEILREFGL
jgi:hypothetical protein